MTEPRTGLIVPVMRARVPVEIALEFPPSPDDEPVREPVTDELYVTYGFDVAEPGAPGPDRAASAPEAVDAPPAGDVPAQAPVPAREGGRGEHVARRHCAELGIEPERLRDKAVANLRIRRPDMALTWDPEVRAVAVAFGGDFEAGLLLDEVLLEKLAHEVDGDLVVAVPARDVFLASGTGHPDGIDRLRRATDHVWAGTGHALLTRDLLVRSGSAWAPLAAS